MVLATEALRALERLLAGSIFSGYNTVGATDELRALRFGCALALGTTATGASTASSSEGLFGALGPIVAGSGSGLASPDLQGTTASVTFFRAAAFALGLLGGGVFILW